MWSQFPQKHKQAGLHHGRHQPVDQQHQGEHRTVIEEVGRLGFVAVGEVVKRIGREPSRNSAFAVQFEHGGEYIDGLPFWL